MKIGKLPGMVGNFLTDASGAASYGVYKGVGKLGGNITLDTAQKVGTGIVGGATVGAAAGLAMNIDEGIGSGASGSLNGAGLGAVGGSAAGVALAIAKGLR